jgi:hypothetical protein
MPSVSLSQRRLMAAAAHTRGGYGGVPQSVGKDFNNADKGRPAPKRERVAAKKMRKKRNG